MTTREETELARDTLYSERKFLQAMLDSDGWKIYSGYLKEQIKVREQILLHGETPTTETLPEHFKKLGEAAGMELVLHYASIRVSEISEEIEELTNRLTAQESGNEDE